MYTIFQDMSFYNRRFNNKDRDDNCFCSRHIVSIMNQTSGDHDFPCYPDGGRIYLADFVNLDSILWFVKFGNFEYSKPFNTVADALEFVATTQRGL